MSIGMYGEADAVSKAIGYAKFFSRSHRALICVYDEASNVIETHEHKGEFKEPSMPSKQQESIPGSCVNVQESQSKPASARDNAQPQVHSPD
jgi:hypothetical protein